MDEKSIHNLGLRGELAGSLWLYFDVNNDIQRRCEKELRPFVLNWSKPKEGGQIAIPYTRDEFESDETPIIGGLIDLPPLNDDFEDFLTDLAELALSTLDDESALLTWMLGVHETDLIYHNLELTTSYYDSRSLILATNKNNHHAYFFFEDTSGNSPYYTGNYREFSSLELAFEHLNAIGEEAKWNDFTIVSSFFAEIEGNGDI